MSEDSKTREMPAGIIPDKSWFYAEFFKMGVQSLLWQNIVTSMGTDNLKNIVSLEIHRAVAIVQEGDTISLELNLVQYYEELVESKLPSEVIEFLYISTCLFRYGERSMFWTGETFSALNYLGSDSTKWLTGYLVRRGCSEHYAGKIAAEFLILPTDIASIEQMDFDLDQIINIVLVEEGDSEEFTLIEGFDSIEAFLDDAAEESPEFEQAVDNGICEALELIESMFEDTRQQLRGYSKQDQEDLEGDK